MTDMTRETALGALRELQVKAVCNDCGMACLVSEILRAPSPFDPDDELSACPHCKSVDDLKTCCQSIGCFSAASGGYPNIKGFRYVSACWDHSPSRGLFVPDPALIAETPA